MGRLEEFDEIAGGVGEQDLASARAGDHLALAGHSGGAEPTDLVVEVVDDEMNAVTRPLRPGRRPPIPTSVLVTHSYGVRTLAVSELGT